MNLAKNQYHPCKVDGASDGTHQAPLPDADREPAGLNP
jgi:hypothetical protein